MTRATPSPEHARLAAALRELKQRTGLSLAGLAQRTAYSRSSWERYLNGKTLPPRQAVQDLCRIAREPQGRCLALWEIAEARWSGRAAEAPEAAPVDATSADTRSPSPQEAGRSGPRGVTVAVLASVCAVAVGGVALALFLLPHEGGAPRSSPPPPATGPRCQGASCEGRSPMHMGCGAGPVTLASYRTATGARMELRYNDRCRAGWARMWGTRVGDRLEVTAGDGTRSAEVMDDLDAEAYVYTAMTEARPGAVLRACFRPAKDGRSECFDGRVNQ
jgi:transcriptional regulator with XRE-family HTH domain